MRPSITTALLVFALLDSLACGVIWTLMNAPFHHVRMVAHVSIHKDPSLATALSPILDSCVKLMLTSVLDQLHVCMEPLAITHLGDLGVFVQMVSLVTCVKLTLMIAYRIHVIQLMGFALIWLQTSPVTARLTLVVGRVSNACYQTAQHVHQKKEGVTNVKQPFLTGLENAVSAVNHGISS